MITLIKDNTHQNNIDFMHWMRGCLNSYYGPEAVLKSPVNFNFKTSLEDEKIFDVEFENYKKELQKKYEAHGSTEEWNIIDGNGDYILPNIVRNETFDETFSKRFVRIYVGLNLRYIVEFFRQFDKLAGEQHLKYYYKFHRKQSTDRFVIYPRNEHLFEICDIIKKIKEEKPYLFTDAIDKLMTTKIVPGIGIASDTPIKKGSTFTTCMGKIVSPYLEEFYNLLPAPSSRMAIFLFLKKYLISEHSDKYGEVSNWRSLISEKDCDLVIDALRNNNRRIRLPNIKPIIQLGFPAKLFCTPDYEKEKLVQRMGNFDNYQTWLYSKNEKEDMPSKKNIAFSDEQLKLLEEIYNKYKATEILQLTK